MIMGRTRGLSVGIFAVILALSSTAAAATPITIQWGLPGDIPVPGHYSSSGPYLELAVWRPSNGSWYVRGAGAAVQWGLPGDVPVPADYDGDGRTDYAVWRPGATTADLSYWLVIHSSTSALVWAQWGLGGDIPVAGDYNGDGRIDYAVWRPANGTWYVIDAATGHRYAVQWGLPGDVPVAPRLNGGSHRFLVWRASNTTWYYLNAATGSSFQQMHGAPGDRPFIADFCGGEVPLTYSPASGAWRSPYPPYYFLLPGDVPVPGNYLGAGADDFAVWNHMTGDWVIAENDLGCVF
jgi:hypothetical protein